MDTAVRVVRELTERGYNAEREAVTVLANAPDTEDAIAAAIEHLPEDALSLTVEHARAGVASTNNPEPETAGASQGSSGSPGQRADESAGSTANIQHTGVSSGAVTVENPQIESESGRETRGFASDHDTDLECYNDVTGSSTGTGVYEDFVAVFRDRYERLSGSLRSRLTHRPTSAVAEMPGGSEAGLIGMVSDIRSTRNGHWLVELEDTSGTFPVLITKDKDVAEHVDELLLDEVIAVEGRLADDSGVLFVDDVHFPDVPRTFEPSTADRHVQAALISDVHVGSQEFMADAWHRFTDWLHTKEAARIEYLLVGGDMVEGVGVYPGQDEELEVVDIYEQYALFSELLKEVPADIEIVMIPGNHDAVRLAEPQPAFDDELREIMSAHDARFTGNPSYVTLEGVTFLVYHGVSLDEVIAEVPAASYEEPHEAMGTLLKKRHLAPQFGERTRVAPEERDYLVIDDVPDVFHAGHVHKLGYGRYHNVTTINSGCWQRQTSFQKSVNLDPDAGYAPIVDLDTLEVTIRKFT